MSTEPNPLATASRAARRTRKLGPDAVCITCGIANPVVLRADGRDKPVPLIQEHHIAGWRVDNDLVAPQCLNCHAIRHEQLRQRGVDLKHPSSNPLDQLLTWLISVSEFQTCLGAQGNERALRVRELSHWLDAHAPGWQDALSGTAS